VRVCHKETCKLTYYNTYIHDARYEQTFKYLSGRANILFDVFGITALISNRYV